MKRPAHTAEVAPVATSVGARWQMRCTQCTARTPLGSQQAAQLAAERHEWETSVPPAPRGAAPSRGGRQV